MLFMTHLMMNIPLTFYFILGNETNEICKGIEKEYKAIMAKVKRELLPSMFSHDYLLSFCRASSPPVSFDLLLHCLMSSYHSAPREQVSESEHLPPANK
jgi:hypothetical protein